MFNWTNRLKRDAKNAKGFTLIELMIVIAIIGILAAVAIPNFLKARDRGRFSAAKETLAGVKTAVEMVAADNPGTAAGQGPYTNAQWGKDNLCKEMLANDSCTDAGTGNAALEARITQSVTGFDLKLAAVGANQDSTYTIKGKAQDKLQCQICITPNGIFPTKYDAVDCAAGTCP